MMTRLDPEQLGIVTMETFLREFFPESSKSKRVTVYHYNGLCRSCPHDKVSGKWFRVLGDFEKEVEKF